METQSREPAPRATRREELRSILFLSVVMAPVLAVIVVAGYGFLVWMVQLIAGPPGRLIAARAPGAAHRQPRRARAAAAQPAAVVERIGRCPAPACMRQRLQASSW